jgi:hypothetical protein
MEDAGIVYVRLVYFTDIWYISCSFGTFVGHLVSIYVVPRKIWQPWAKIRPIWSR